MKKMNLKVLNITLLALLFGGLFLLKEQALAAVRCETQYGGGQICVRTGELQINKKIVLNNVEYDNLGTDRAFAPGDTVTFKLYIKNVGDETFDKVQVTDTLPELLTRESGDLSFEISDLRAGETEDRTITAKVVAAERFPADSVCDGRTTNTAEVKSGDKGDKDTAKVCVAKRVLGVAPTTPVTGPEEGLLILALSLLAGLTGFSLLRFSQLYR